MNLFEIRSMLNKGINLKDINLRVTYYSRVSTDSKEQKTSLENQTNYFINYIKENSNWIFIDGYVDEGISGTSDFKREQFMKMIEDAKNDNFDLIITKEISRFSRNTLDSIKYTRELLNNGVAVLFLNDNINTIYLDSELRLTIMSSLAQDEIRRLSERVKFGMSRSQEKGILLGNNIIYGYDKKNNKLIINKEEAKVIKNIFNMYLYEDMSLTKIKNDLNNKNIKTKMNKKWTTTTLSRLIKNPKYKGYYCGRKVETIDYMSKKIKYNQQDEWITFKDKKIPTIIVEKVWDKANEKINKKNKKRDKITGIYQNKIYCLNDNYLYYPKINLKKKKEISYYCANYLKNKKCSCISANIREKELNMIFKDIIEEIKLKKIIKEILGYKNIFIDKYLNEKIYNYLVEKILVKKINDNIYMNIYLKMNISLRKDYLFFRDNNKYKIKYIVETLHN